ncbi:uncharacterized protein B0H18DRAFT_989370 [Fomitopsis serialis]|uniref:uncharacterized protein n=1 Tax=Fomitopsis serialis TaxID=139415 RepID=UPI002008393A|nr:uncharacterized protein B0H18DRAFT_989370 [Neoantrodia serialis]KAH9931445.1 hypothetical protein B0H18DRAFT_989370 [Neoantrodia serialis]
MKIVFASAWFAFLTTVLLTAFVSPEPVSASTTANFAKSIFRELKDAVHKAQDVINDVVLDSFGPLTPNRFWQDALSLGRRGQDYAGFLIHEAAQKEDPTTAARLYDIQSTMEVIVHDTGDLKELIIAQVPDESFDNVRRGIEKTLANILEDLKDRFPPPDHALSHAEREGNVTLVVNIIEESLIKFGVEHGISEEQLKMRLAPIMKHVEDVVVAIGDLAEQHPYLLKTLLVSGVMIIIPEAWFLRPLLRFFGFAPKGPAKGGSLATWTQRTFYGGTVTKGSWFSYLHRAAFGRWEHSTETIYHCGPTGLCEAITWP